MAVQDRNGRDIAVLLPSGTEVEWNPVMRKHGVKFIFTEDLGETPDGRKLRGRIALRERVIWIDQSLQDELYRLRFTIAHEIGRLALHRHRPIRGYARIDDTDDDLRMRFNHGASSRHIVERQANRYAASTLMPRYTVAMAILIFHQEKEIKLNVGRVYVDNSRGNRDLYRETLARLSLIYHVSRTVARIRLDELGLLIDRRESRVKRLSDEFVF